jgi:Transcription factor WhiB
MRSVIERRFNGVIRPETAPSYPVGAMNNALVKWLMSPDAPDEPLLISDFLNRPTWHGQAACKTVGVGAYFAQDEGSLELARAICAGCPVPQECHDVAMADPSLEGIWAGYDAKGRRALPRAVA